MLIITRKIGESVMIGDDIEVTISKTVDGNIKLGINAPKEVTILRKEIYEQVKQENTNAIKFDIKALNKIKK